MAPGIVSELPSRSGDVQNGNGHNKAVYPEPLNLSGALEKFTYEDTTPVIGREFFNVNIVDDLLNANDADELLRDLAITSMYFVELYLTSRSSPGCSFPTRCRLFPRPGQSVERSPETIRSSAGTT